MIIPLQRLVVLASAVLVAVCGCRRESEPPTNHQPSSGQQQDSTPSFAMNSDERLTASVENPQVVHGDTFEDYDYAFTLTRPSREWQFLNQRKAMQLTADAAMAMVNVSKQSYVAIIVERLEGVALNDYVDMILSNFPAGSARELERKAVRVDGHPGVVVKVEATIDGVSFTYRFLLTKNGDFFYQLLGWAMSPMYSLAESGIVAIQESLSFVEGRSPKVRAVIAIDDDYGVDWKIAGNVYANASFGFRLRPRDGFRLAGRQELAGMGADAAAAILCSNPTFYQVYMVELAGDRDLDEFVATTLLMAEQNLGLLGTELETSSVEIAGMPAEQRFYPKVDQGGADFDFVQTLFYRSAVVYRIQSWWPSAESEAARTYLQSSYKLFEWLKDTERAQLAAELVTYDADNAVGLQFSLRGGVFRDFLHGFTYTLPTGLWHASTGDGAHAENAEAGLILSLPAQGVHVVLVPELLTMEHAQYHELLRQNMGVSAGVPTESRKNGDLELLVSAFDTMVSNIHHSFRLVTAVRGRKHVQLLVSGLKSNEKNVDAQLPLIIRGLDVPKSTLKIMERKGRVLTDHRLGFEMRYEDGWLAEQMNIPGIEALGNMITLSRKNTVCIGMAICATEGFDEDVAIESMMQTSQVHVDPTSRTEIRSKLARIPARQFAFSGRRGGVKVTLTAWIAHRGNTAYLLLVIAEAGELSKPEAFRRFFALID